MTVTELARFQPLSRSDGVSSTIRDLMASAIKVQDGWCAANLSSTDYMTKGPEARGVALFEQFEFPGVVLLTAHWNSVDQHMEWIRSKENQESYPVIQEHLDMSQLVFFHVDDVAAFRPEILQADVVGVIRYFVPREKKAAVDSGLAKVEFEAQVRFTVMEAEVKGVVEGGWRIEKDDAMVEKGLEEYVVVIGTDGSIDAGKIRVGMLLEEIFKGCDREARHYARVL